MRKPIASRANYEQLVCFAFLLLLAGCHRAVPISEPKCDLGRVVTERPGWKSLFEVGQGRQLPDALDAARNRARLQFVQQITLQAKSNWTRTVGSSVPNGVDSTLTTAVESEFGVSGIEFPERSDACIVPEGYLAVWVRAEMPEARYLRLIAFADSVLGIFGTTKR